MKRQKFVGEVIHGGKGTRLYRIWKNMRSRCNNPTNPRYYAYGEKGIKICGDWDRFEVFREWAEKNGYNDNLTIDRRDVEKGYCPENCQWITYQENHNKMMDYNKKNNRGQFSPEAVEKRKRINRKRLGKTTYCLIAGDILSFTSRGELVDFLSEYLDRKRNCVKSQVTQVLSGKCLSIAGIPVWGEEDR